MGVLHQDQATRPRPRGTRKVVLGSLLGAFALMVALAAINWRPIVARWATQRAHEEARVLVGGKPASQDFEKSVLEVLAERHAPFFRRGLIDRQYLARRFPASAVTPEALPWWAAVWAYYFARRDMYENKSDEQLVEISLDEFRAWWPLFVRSTAAKEGLVHLLTADYTAFEKPREQTAGLVKQGLIDILHPDRRRKFQPLEERLLALVTPTDWQTLLDQSRHSNELVRAGCILLLLRHPSREVFVERAREALEDPARWVRIAAAGSLAWHGNAEGVQALVDGFADGRWEIRYFCARSLVLLGDPLGWEAIVTQAKTEPDPWVRNVLVESAKAKTLKR